MATRPAREKATSEGIDDPVAPEVIAFDVIGTLFSLSALEPLAVAAGGDASTVGRWLTQLVADGSSLTAAREYQPFRDVARASLRTVLSKSKAAARDKVLGGLAKLDVYEDAAPAMGRLIMAGRAVVISNASADSTRKLLARGRL